MFDIFPTMCHGNYSFWTQLYVFLAASYIGYPFLHIDLGDFSAKISSNIFYALSFLSQLFFLSHGFLSLVSLLDFKVLGDCVPSYLFTSFPLLPSEWNIALILLLSLGAVGLS